MRTRISHFADFTLASGEDIELELEHTPVDGLDAHTVETAEHVIHAYLVHDEDTANPLEDCDGMGKIHHHPRSRYGRRDSDYFEVLGLDSNGNPVIDEKKMQDLWHAKVMAVPLREFHIADKAVRAEIRRSGVGDYREILRRALANEAAGDYTVEDQCRHAWYYRPDVPRELIAGIVERIEDRIDWNYDAVARECAEPGDPDAVLLDLYDHGLQSWSVSGGGMQCRWDTSRGLSVWVPDKYARKEIDRRAPVFNHAWIEKTNWLRGKGKQYLLHFGDKDGVFSDDWSELWDKAVEIAEACRAAGATPRFDGRRRAAVEMASEACEQYTDWSNGNCYGWVVQVHTKDGELLDLDSCWGYVGTEYAEETLKEEFDHVVERIKCEESTPPRNPNQMEIRL